jgi:hypothetical protein
VPGARKKSGFLNLYTFKNSGGLVPAFFIRPALGFTAPHRGFLRNFQLAVEKHPSAAPALIMLHCG